MRGKQFHLTLRALRAYYGIKKDAFRREGSIKDVAEGSIAGIESGDRLPSELALSTICSEFDFDPKLWIWLHSAWLQDKGEIIPSSWKYAEMERQKFVNQWEWSKKRKLSGKFWEKSKNFKKHC